jgi:membrane-bound serine protease (ClpP class)
MRHTISLRVFLVLTLTVLFSLAFTPLAFTPPVSAQLALPSSSQLQENPTVLVLTAKGPLTPIMVGYVGRGLQQAQISGAEAMILQLDTPGGDIGLMNSLVQEIRNSTVPVVVYVYPTGAMAASAGTIITLAGHVSAMAPETTIGAASPVGSQGEDIGTTMESKVKEVLKATARTLTANRPLKAVQLAQQTIDNARAVTVDEALEIGLIDIKAKNLADLLDQLDGRQVRMSDTTRTLHTRGALATTLPLNFIEELLQLLTNPNIVFLLLSIGVQAILIELSSPGGWVAGFIGVVCLLLAVYGLGILPVNWFGILFLLLAFVLFILDIKAPTHGGLTVAGVASFITGALILFNSVRVPGFAPVSVPLVIGTGIFIGLTFLVILTFALRALRAPLRTGREILAGKAGMTRTELNPTGQVQVAGELWSAELSEADAAPIPPGTRIVVVRVDGLRLIVRREF